MNCINQSIAQMINNTQGVNMVEICKFLNEDKLNELFHVIQTINEKNLERNLMISEDYNVAEKKNKPKSKKVWNEKVWCEICEKHIFKATKSKHYKTNKHLDNLAIKNKQKMSKEELQNIRIRFLNKKIKTITTDELKNKMLDKKPLTKEELRRMKEVLKRINERKKIIKSLKKQN